jgi:hypothetical protein
MGLPKALTPAALATAPHPARVPANGPPSRRVRPCSAPGPAPQDGPRDGAMVAHA